MDCKSRRLSSGAEHLSRKQGVVSSILTGGKSLKNVLRTSIITSLDSASHGVIASARHLAGLGRQKAYGSVGRRKAYLAS